MKLPHAHPDRGAAIIEAHARPAPSVPVPGVLHHFALFARDAGALYAACFGAEYADVPRHAVVSQNGATIYWERHTEFCTLLVVGQGWEGDVAPMLERISTLGDDCRLLTALRVTVRETAKNERPPSIVGGELRGGIAIASSLQPGGDGLVDVEIVAAGIGPDLLGRRIKRFIEAETYRTMAFLGLAEGRRVEGDLGRLELALSAVTEEIAEGAGASDEVMLDRLQQIAAEAEALRDTTRFRFSASCAYATLVEERLDSLHETKVGERPTYTGFALTRLGPSVRTITSLENRQAELADAVGRTLELLRARIDISLDRGNQAILASMNDRQDRQLRLAQAVEGLSVVAISYYLVGLLSYPAKALLGADGAKWGLAILAPMAVLLVFAVLRMVKKRIMRSNV